MFSVFYYVSSQALHPSNMSFKKTTRSIVTIIFQILFLGNNRHFLRLLGKKKPKIEHSLETLLRELLLLFPYIKAETDNISFLPFLHQIVFATSYTTLIFYKSQHFLAFLLLFRFYVFNYLTILNWQTIFSRLYFRKFILWRNFYANQYQANRTNTTE